MLSMLRAISSALRRSVPLKTMCSVKCAIPFRAAVSLLDPLRSHIPTEIDRTCGIGSVTITNPFGNTSR
jgi:hypothetical protein